MLQQERQLAGKTFCMIDGNYWRISRLSGLKENLFWLLYVLDDGGFYTQKQLCEEWLFPKTTINTLVKECEAAGYITLKAIPGRRRELQLCLTEAGRAYTKKELELVHRIEEQALAAVPDTARFLDDLQTFARAMQSALEAN